MRIICTIVMFITFGLAYCGPNELQRIAVTASALSSTMLSIAHATNMLRGYENDRSHKKTPKQFEKSAAQRRNSVADQRGRRRLIPVKIFGSADAIKGIVMSEEGKNLAYNRNGIIVISSPTGEESYLAGPQEIVGIKSMRFLGDDRLVYVYIDNAGKKHLMLVQIQSKEYKELSTAACEDIRLYGRGSNLLVTSSNGEEHFLYRFNPQSQTLQEITSKKSPITTVLMNNNSFIYQTGNQLILHTGSNERIIDNNVSRDEKYIAFSNNGDIYKIMKNMNGVTLHSINSQGRTVQLANYQNLELPLDNCSFVQDTSGAPVLMTVNDFRLRHAAIKGSINVGQQTILTSEIIGRISGKFQNKDWRVVDISRDFRFWLIRVSSPNVPTMFVQIDLMGNFRVVRVIKQGNNGAIKFCNSNAVTIHTNEGNNSSRGINALITLPKVYQKNTPAIVLLRRNDSRIFSWEFNQLAQFLADRGYVVLSVNRSCKEGNPSLIMRDIQYVVEWLKTGHTISLNNSNSRNIFPVSLNNVIMIFQSKHAEDIRCCFDGGNFVDQHGNRMAGLCLLGPKNLEGMSLGNFQLPTMVISQSNQLLKSQMLITSNNLSIFMINKRFRPEQLDAILSKFISQCLHRPWNIENVQLNNLSTISDGLRLLQ